MSASASADSTVPADAPVPGYRSPLLDLPGAVPAEGPDAGVAAHYGDPLREQRRAAAGAAVVDRSHRGVARVGGPDRLSWLHNLASQHLSALRPMRGTEALLLSPHGHVEHHLVIADDGAATWIDVEPGGAAGLVAFLESMRFLLRVEPADVTATTAVLSVLGPRAAEAVADALGGGADEVPAGWSAPPAEAAGGLPEEAGRYPLARLDPAVLARRMPYGVDLLVERARLSTVVDRLRVAGVEPAGIDAFEADRIAAHRPRLGADTDHRTIPHEVGWLTAAVHLDKGCYRGQETVARVHNLGRPPRRLVLLHLDGAVAAPGSPVTAAGRQVGFVGSSRMHAELGPIALAMLKRAVPDDAALVTADLDGHEVAARIDPDSGPVRPDRPAGRLLR
ncbi:CAF17-like 4Fe-4S cluster assembly/insertion protein YgfZ [Frankia nepalensis]|uniref:Folate-binding protein YgfZ n=1 Tax=Frankia nepalensis TaxID=1836974 RepID=A0A937RFX4_9ACTN|nr:glycine cleavage T C-terminal barrel domain-containing protein [Frankia nepalensis]MBL7496002.1 folate-binding protein YgfZ [Frankia nepalensis]MBL7514948.1 folate-binding protein YgfZ [Frankia nepalensis]MBL7631443.1 folate-binding protein YgfZ [Frankia nepalensis]